MSITDASLVKVNQYTFIGTLGRGSFAEVTLARADSGSRFVRIIACCGALVRAWDSSAGACVPLAQLG